MVRLTLSVLVAIALSSLATACGGANPPSAFDRGRATAAYGDLPLTFVENRGQTDKRVRFQAQGPGHAFYLTPGGIALTLQKSSGKGVALDLHFLGANPNVAPSGAERAPGTVNYLEGDDPARWQTEVPAYGEIVYRDLWPGIDMALRGQGGELKYEFRVRAGARPQDIRLAYRGAQGLRRDRSGALQIDTGIGALKDEPPVAYQEIGGARVAVASRYALDGERGYGFAVGRYDPTRELIIDPALAYSTFLGGASHEQPGGITVDAAGNAYVTGFTQSPDFPTTPGAFDRTGAANNSVDAFVSKLNPTGTALVYSTFLGGSNFDWGRAITIDTAGNAYVTGQTQSSNFPTTGGAFDRTFNVDSCPRCGIDQYDAFVAKLNPTGTGLVYSTFLGGFDLDDSLGIAIDGARNAYVAGETVSNNFPVTAGAFDTTANGGFDTFVTKLNTTGSALVYSTRLGGGDNELPAGVKVDTAGNAFVGGGTRSVDFPTTPGAFDTTQNGGAFDERFDGFVTKLNAAGSGLVFSTFVGGSKSDFDADFSLDAAGNTYLVGNTLSPDFPTTAGAFDRVFGGGDGFALKLNAAGSSLIYSTFLGEAGAAAVAPDAAGNAWVGGGRNADAYVARLNATGSALDSEFTFGGSEGDGVYDAALDAGANNLYVTGATYSPNFTTTPGVFDRVWGGDPNIFWGEAFVAKIDVNATAVPTPTPSPAPAAPALVSPADAAVVASPVTFDWGDVSGATSYTIQVDEISQFGAPLVLSANTTGSQFTTSALPDGTWFWRVRGLASDGTPGAWSAVRTITVQSTPTPTPPPTPGTPSLVSPAAGAQVTQPFTFDWSDVANAAWYVIEADDSSSFAAPLVWAATTTPSQLATNSLPNGTVFWRVRAFNSDGVAGPYSAVRTVVVGATSTPTPGPLAAPSLLSPSNDARFSPGQQITFDWSDVAGAANYTIQIDDSSSFSAPLTATSTVAASQFATSTLPERKLYWRVRANDGGAWSSSRRVEVKD